MSKKIVVVLSIFVVCILTMVACGGGGDYKPGTYTGQSSENTMASDEGDLEGDYGVVELTIGENNEITACEFKTYEKDGTLKDENYGKQNGEVANADFYSKAQKAREAAQQYADEYVKTQSLDEVEAISGATINYDQFREAVEVALEKAQE